MDRPFTQLFSPPELSVTDITGNLPGWCSYRIPYAKAERTIIKEGTIVSQYHSHVLFFIEVMEINLHQELESSYLIKDASLFLFMVLGGGVTFYTTNMQPIANAPEAICYAAYNKAGEYVYRLPAGIHRLCYLCLLPSWISSNIKRYPRLEPFMEEMMESGQLFGHLPPCKINNELQDNLLSLLSGSNNEGSDLESNQSRDAKALIDAYQALLDRRYEQRAYRIKDYLEEHYTDNKLSNDLLAMIFNTTKKTLVRDFRDTFSIAPHAYLITVRMNRAKVLLDEGLNINLVYALVGYADVRSFGKQFKIFFGFPPSSCR